MSPVQTVAIIGAGLMGSGIAEVSVAQGYDVLLIEQDSERLEGGMGRIRSRFAREVDRGRQSQQDADAALARLSGATSLEAAADRDLVIEAIFENLEAKQSVFRDLGRICKPDAILASNTSSISLSALAGVSGRAERVIGLHFFNPPGALKLLEMIPSSATSEETIEAAAEFCKRIERITVRATDSPGFIVNRLLIPFLFDAIRMVEAGVATAADVDHACRFGLNHTMGPLATADLIGLDTLAGIGDSMFEELGEPRFKSPGLLRRLVSLGQLGRKSGAGFLSYDAQG